MYQNSNPYYPYGMPFNPSYPYIPYGIPSPPPNQSYFNSPITSSSSPFVPISSTNFTLKAQPVSNGQPVVTSENSPKTILEISSNQQNPEIRSNQQQCIVSPNPMFMYYPDSFQNHR